MSLANVLSFYCNIQIRQAKCHYSPYQRTRAHSELAEFPGSRSQSSPGNLLRTDLVDGETKNALKDHLSL